MSFSNDVRNELARIIPDKICCQKAELSALLILRGKLAPNPSGELGLTTIVENATPARKVYRLLKEAYGLSSTVRIQEKKRFKKSRLYVVETAIDKPDGQICLKELGLFDNVLKPQVNWALLGKNCCKRAYLRGIFISRGFINRPEGNYHLELVLNDSKLVSDVQKIMRKLSLEARISERKNSLLLYIKESEKIVDFLRLVEASKALLDFENVRIVKSMRNQVNRQVNCETANLAKTVDASVRQVEMIEKLLDKIGVKGLPPNLRDLAMLRLDYPDSTFKEMGVMLDPPLTKSGVAYRMKKLEGFAATILDE
ncbi:MAG: DNA-binding protein WhiA [Syntrophomonadaceae bacterium]|nr:DNA-binding protein WhiA [Syntrophomonadaceae bacterium]